jgi:hypothetical protein
MGKLYNNRDFRQSANGIVFVSFPLWAVVRSLNVALDVSGARQIFEAVSFSPQKRGEHREERRFCRRKDKFRQAEIEPAG